MTQLNINDFMDRMHRIERDLGLFDDTVDGQLWWDTVRFETCTFIFGCLLSSSSTVYPVPDPRSSARPVASHDPEATVVR